MKRKIGIVTEYYYPHLGGITEHVHYYSQELLKRGHEVVLLTGNQGGLHHPPLPGLRILRFGKSFPIFSNEAFAKVTVGFNLGRKIRRVLAEEKFDILHIQSPLTPVLPLLFEKYTNTVTVGTIHTYFDAIYCYKIFRERIQAYLDKLDGIISVSPSCIEAMGRYFKGDYTIIPNGVETSWFAPASNGFRKIKEYDDGVLNILYLGRLDPRNGLDYLLEAFPIIHKRLPNTRLLIVGDGPLRDLYEEEAGELLNESIFFEGQINSERPEYFATSHVFCYPATKASFGITLLEAMSAGVPVVATDNKGFRDVIQHGVNGLLAKPGDSFDLAEVIIKALEDKALAQSLSKNGLQTAENYSWSHITDRILAFYDQVFMKTKGVPFAS
ncbi:MAG: glycosyltransferase family 4 protein [Deltaproteobacteria bacterium]|nr:glycosyltransferase family 4 protein [Deltaproteobacteria bacterium]